MAASRSSARSSQTTTSTCPICGERVTDWQAHYAQELERLKTSAPLPPKRRMRLDSAPASRNHQTEFQRLRANRVKRQAGAPGRSRGKRRRYLDDTQKQVEQETCFMCHEPLGSVDADAVNAHIDACLLRQSMPASPPASSPSRALEKDNVDETYTWAGKKDMDEEVVETYTWAGQERIRVTSLYQGNLARDLSSAAPASARDALEEEVDVNVDEDADEQFGAAQFDESLLLQFRAQIQSRDDAHEISDAQVQDEISHAEDKDEISDAQAKDKTDKNTDKSHAARHASDELLIVSLKDRVRELEAVAGGKAGDAARCLVCLGGYAEPLVSTE
ncbi:MAG: hypothetical protein SGCHY_003881, partial [Lobulomycetales sp.]